VKTPPSHPPGREDARRPDPPSSRLQGRGGVALCGAALAFSFAFVIALLAPASALAQLSPFSDSGTVQGGGRGLPVVLSANVIEPVVNPRESSADRIARVFNRRLRDLEESQRDIVEQFEELPRIQRESERTTELGYHSGASATRPKWLQIDLGEVVSPDAVVLFPVTAQVDDETVYGYGFPRNFRIDISSDEDFRNYETMVEGVVEQQNGVRRWPFMREVEGFSGRYLRVTASGLWRSPRTGQEVFALSEVMVLKGGRNIAVNRPVTRLDSEERAGQWSSRFVTDGITTLGLPHGLEESPSLGFRADSQEEVASSWVQVDLGESMRIDEIQLVLADSPGPVPDPTVRFPFPIAVEVSERPDMTQAEAVGRFTPSRISVIGSNPLILAPSRPLQGRYVRATVQAGENPARIAFELAEMIVFSDNENVALGKTVSASHAIRSEGWAPEYLVDGYSSRRKLVSYQEWLSGIDKRNRLVSRWIDKEEQRLDLVDRTVTLSLSTVAAGVATVLALVLLILARARVKRRKELEDLRQRIASDLHDDIGSNLSSIALLAELGKTETDEPELVLEELTEIKATADKTIESMRDIVWLIRPGEETWAQMLARFRETAAKLLRGHEYTFIVKGDSHDDRLPLEFKRDIFLIFKEALNNIVRHAKAETVNIEVEGRRNRLQLSIQDDGIGFNDLDEGFREGNGLRNLRMRAQAIGAHLKVRSGPGEGTAVLLTVPMP